MKLLGCSARQIRSAWPARHAQWHRPRIVHYPWRAPFGTQAGRGAAMKRGQSQTDDDPDTALTAAMNATLAKVDLSTASADIRAVVAEIRLSTVKYARAVPLSPSYFSRATVFSDMMVEAQDLLDRYSSLPTVPRFRAPRVDWMGIDEHRGEAGERILTRDYVAGVGMARRLNRIDPALRPPEIREALKRWAKGINSWDNRPKPTLVDARGRALGVGRRKEATAQAWVVEGTGEVFVNGKSLVEAFGRVHDRESAVWALFATNRMDKYNVWAIIRGGGPTGQSEAMAMAVAKALVAHEPALKRSLRRAGCITRDPREVERKKTGRRKARKRPAWVKR